MHSATEPVTKGKKWWIQFHNSHNPKARKQNPSLVFLGDSLTHQWAQTGKRVWKRHYQKRNAVNFGIGGDRTEHILWRVEDGLFKGLSPKVVVILAGTNNAWTNTAQETAEGVVALVKAVRQKSPSATILLLGILPRGKDDSDTMRALVFKANQTFQTIADGKHIHYLDIGHVFLNQDRTISETIMPDHLHLSVRGYELWAQAMEPKLAQLLGEVPPKPLAQPPATEPTSRPVHADPP